MPKVSTLKPRLQHAVTTRIHSGDSWREGRTGSTARLYTYRWQQERAQFLEQHPLCQCPECDEGRKRLTLATVVDHHEPHRGDPIKFWDKTNWRAMGKACHDRKTAGGA